MTSEESQHNKFLVGYRPIIHARQGRMLGIRQPLDKPVLDKLEDAERWCLHTIISHYDRRLGMSDARIEPFKGMVDSGGPPSEPAQLQDIIRICEAVGRKVKARFP
jgi:hypothetical protein